MKPAMRFFLVVGLVISASALAADMPCTTCHAGFTAGDVHAAAETPCEACHGPGDEHVTNPTTGIIRFGDGPTAERIAACRGCHTDVHAANQSSHEQAGFACDDCHTVHGNEAQSQVGQALPAGFHQDLVRVVSQGYATPAASRNANAASEPANAEGPKGSGDGDTGAGDERDDMVAAAGRHGALER